ncbi:MAG: hypothetical protein K2X97_13830, partial [Mycobacteriaceae bacterium]|nr:hypothetical protein [Mycobacteriaceae bacterium]
MRVRNEVKRGRPEGLAARRRVTNLMTGAMCLAAAGAASAAMTDLDAARLATQASFGNTEALTAEIKTLGPARWVAAQMTLANSRYRSGGNGTVNQNTSQVRYCDQPAHAGPNCWRDNYSTIPLVWDFYRNAISQPDQLRQR